jgi:hypothetical protein
VNCCAAHRSSPVRYLAIVALSAVAFIGQAIGVPSVADASVATIVGAHPVLAQR